MILIRKCFSLEQIYLSNSFYCPRRHLLYGQQGQILFHIISPTTMSKFSLTRIISSGLPEGTSKHINKWSLPVNDYGISLLLKTIFFSWVLENTRVCLVPPIRGTLLSPCQLLNIYYQQIKSLLQDNCHCPR